MTKPWQPGKAANKDPKLRLMRSAKTRASYSHGMGGLPRKVKGATPSLPRLKCLEAKEGEQ